MRCGWEVFNPPCCFNTEFPGLVLLLPCMNQACDSFFSICYVFFLKRAVSDSHLIFQSSLSHNKPAWYVIYILLCSCSLEH